MHLRVRDSGSYSGERFVRRVRAVVMTDRRFYFG